MNGNSYKIRKVEGGFIVEIDIIVPDDLGQPTNCLSRNYIERIFTDSSVLLNFLHNELVGSN